MGGTDGGEGGITYWLSMQSYCGHKAWVVVVVVWNLVPCGLETVMHLA